MKGHVQWIVDQWKQWGVTAIIVGATNTITWLFARRKEWRAARQARAERKIDAQILEILGKPDLWGYQRPLTGAGIPLVRAAELAQQLALDLEAVGDSLERLESRGRVLRTQGTMDNLAPYWHIMLR